MSEYFKNMPALYYRFDTGTNHAGKKIDIIHQKLVTDISLRHRLKTTIKSAIYTLYYYDMLTISSTIQLETKTMFSKIGAR